LSSYLFLTSSSYFRLLICDYCYWIIIKKSYFSEWRVFSWVYSSL